jgi:hypothetical protein
VINHKLLERKYELAKTAVDELEEEMECGTLQQQTDTFPKGCFDLSRSLTSRFVIVNTARRQVLHVPNQVIANTARHQVFFGPNPEPYGSQARSDGVGDQRSGNSRLLSEPDFDLLVRGKFVVKSAEELRKFQKARDTTEKLKELHTM